MKPSSCKKNVVSVCMATYNGEKYIKEQLISILFQLSEEDEVIISDDGSHDSTLEIIDSFHDNRIKIYHNSAPHGVVPNFENAIKHASGEFVFLCDQDDVWEDGKVEICKKYLSHNILVLHDASIIDKNGVEIQSSYFKLRGSKIGYFNNVVKNSYLGCCMAFRWNLLKYILPFPGKIEMHDRWIGLQAELYGRTVMVNRQLSRYRIHGENVSNSTEKSKNDFITMLQIRLWLLFFNIVSKINNLFTKKNIDEKKVTDVY